MFNTYDEYIKFNNSISAGRDYDAESLSKSLKPLYAKGWNSKKIAEKAGICSIAFVHKASQGKILSKNKFIAGQWIKVVDDENLSKLVGFLRKLTQE